MSIACCPERTVVECDVCQRARISLPPMPRKPALYELALRGWGVRRIGRHEDQVCPGCVGKRQSSPK